MNSADRALEYLNRYKKAKRDAETMQVHVEFLRMQAEGISSSMNIERGWTGRMFTDRRGQKQPELVPIRRGTTRPQNREQLLAVLADESADYERKIGNAILLMIDISDSIEDYRFDTDENLFADILRLRHIDLCTFAKIGQVLNYSSVHVIRLHSSALASFGEWMAQKM